MYNEKVKSDYLNKYDNEETRIVYSRIFAISATLESKYNKDLYDFNEEQLELLLKDHVKPKTKQSARSYCNVVSAYIQWGIEKGYSSNLINPFRRKQDYYYTLVKSNTLLYMSKRELYNIVDSLKNEQDQFILLGLFYGIQGKQLSELISVKVGDIDENNNIIQIKDDEGQVVRNVKVDTKTIKTAILANKQKDYDKKNGCMVANSKLSTNAIMMDSVYILKSVYSISKKENQKISHFTVHNRLEVIKETSDIVEYSDALNTKNIVRSGMIYMASKLLVRDGEIGVKQMKEICNVYGVSYKWAMKDFINEEMIFDLYPELKEQFNK